MNWRGRSGEHELWVTWDGVYADPRNEGTARAFWRVNYDVVGPQAGRHNARALGHTSTDDLTVTLVVNLFGMATNGEHQSANRLKSWVHGVVSKLIKRIAGGGRIDRAKDGVHARFVDRRAAAWDTTDPEATPTGDASSAGTWIGDGDPDRFDDEVVDRSVIAQAWRELSDAERFLAWELIALGNSAQTTATKARAEGDPHGIFTKPEVKTPKGRVSDRSRVEAEGKKVRAKLSRFGNRGRREEDES